MTLHPPPSPRTFASTTRRLQRDTPPMRLFEKAKRYGIWNPSDLDFTQDNIDWARMTPREQDVLLRLTAMFCAGEEAVTLDLLPLIQTIAREGRLEEEMFLTTFLWEEAKHTDFFNRVLTDGLPGVPHDLRAFHGPAYRTLFEERLPAALGALLNDPSPANQVMAAVTYNMIVEGTLAETGYHAYHTMLAQNGLMPGTCEGVRLLKQDESRHIAYGIYLIARLVADDASLWALADAHMTELLSLAVAIIQEIFAPYGDDVPFGLSLDTFLGYAAMQYQKRYARIAQAQGVSLQAVAAMTLDAIARDDA